MVGSINSDYIVTVSRPAVPGETLLAHDLRRQPGGKGANQAVAARRMGANVTLIAAVGDDENGWSNLRALEAEGVDTSNVEIAGGQTGLAMVTVFDSGENSIIVVPGANFSLAPARVAEAVRRAAALPAILVVQAESEPAVVESAIHAAAETGMRVVFNLAPYREFPSDILAAADPLILNEHEASSLLGWPVTDVETALSGCTELCRTARSAVITLGASGACWPTGDRSGHQAADGGARVVDTTGAGDAFVGALATTLSVGDDLEEAVRVGVLAGTFAVSAPGAQSSYATRSHLDAHSGND
ncbi:ribokinase [Leifsonia sp. 2MCAF36]|uniref:ribokinase n=1 Tax=Leifsonia sp. 2MCAF36 TaxID=3232988 RepID=UPI003F99A3DF